jgi:L-lactate dehydrogenase complex protein LldG
VNAREEVLARIRAAHAAAPTAPAEIPRGYRRAGQEHARHQVLELMVDRLVDYKAEVRRCRAEDIAATVAEALAAHGAGSVVVPSGVPDAWLPEGVRVVTDDPVLSNAELDATDAVLTGSAVASADTGTIVLDASPDQGRRALSLVPDLHVCVLRAGSIVPSVPDAVAALDATRPLTWISGPSATSDIELSRVEGVHGPRTLSVVIVED